MSAGHFLFSLGMTAYILLAIPLEERDLTEALGEPYTPLARTHAGVRAARLAGQPPSDVAARRRPASRRGEADP